MVEQSETNVDTRTLVILALSATAGVLVEFYDFLIYGFAAASAFPSIFVPRMPATQGLVLSISRSASVSLHASWAHSSSATLATARGVRLRS